MRDRVRPIVESMLVQWGEWESLDLYGARMQRSVLGRLIADGPSAPCGAAGPAAPRIDIPRDVAEIGRCVAAVRERPRSGERYYAAIRHKFVLAEKTGAGLAPSGFSITPTVVCRAVDAVADEWAAIRRARG